MLIEILRKDTINDALIVFHEQKVRVKCDRNCAKAWGRYSRPKYRLSKDEDDWKYYNDAELDTAPEDPETREGNVSKPKTPDAFPNRWCVRECERCAMSAPGEWMYNLELRQF